MLGTLWMVSGNMVVTWYLAHVQQRSDFLPPCVSSRDTGGSHLHAPIDEAILVFKNCQIRFPTTFNFFGLIHKCHLYREEHKC